MPLTAGCPLKIYALAPQVNCRCYLAINAAAYLPKEKVLFVESYSGL